MKFIHVFTPLIARIYMTINYHLKKYIVELIHANYKYFFCLANWIFIYHSIISSSENLVLNYDY